MSQDIHHVQVIARLNVRPHQVEPMVDLMSQLSRDSRAAPGNIRFEVLQCANDPTEFVTRETWENDLAASKHMSSEYVEKTLRKLSAMLSNDLTINPYTQLA